MFSASIDTWFYHNSWRYRAELFTGAVVRSCVRCCSSRLWYQEHLLMRPVLVTSLTPVCNSLNPAVMFNLTSRAVFPVPSADTNKRAAYSAALSKLRIKLDCIWICKYKILIVWTFLQIAVFFHSCFYEAVTTERSGRDITLLLSKLLPLSLVLWGVMVSCKETSLLLNRKLHQAWELSLGPDFAC